MWAKINRFIHCLLFFIPLLCTQYAQAERALFDTHLHYNKEDASLFSPGDIIDRLDRSGIKQAVVMGVPADQVHELHRLRPERIHPFLMLAHSRDDKTSWVNDSSTPGKLIAALDAGNWRGIGEIHIFADDRHSNVFAQVIMIATQRRLPILMHADPAVIDMAYDISSDVEIIWAHAGTFPYPDLIEDYLHRYPALMIDLSMRDERILKDGLIDDAWYELLVSYPDRFFVGVDTFGTARWQNFDEAVAIIRRWLGRLPDEAAQAIAHDNAERILSGE